MRSCSRIGKLTITLLTAAGLGACAAPPEAVPAAAFERIAISTPDTLTGAGRPQTKTERANIGATGGAATGAAGGALFGTAAAAAACGPYLYALCVAAGAFSGTLYGAAAGMAAGTLYGTTGISERDALYVDEVMSLLDQDHDYQRELSVQLNELVPPAWQALPQEADATAIVNLRGIRFVQRSQKQIQVELNAALVFSTPAADQTRSFRKFEYQDRSPEHPIDWWLADRGSNLGASIRRSIERIAGQMHAELLALREPAASEKAL